MARIVTLNGVKPKIGKNCFLASTAVIIGDVEIADNCSIWDGAVLRGDVGKIRVGQGTNIQDNAVIHSSAGRSWVEIGEGTSIGHNAVVHGAIVGAHVLIGMNSVILDNAEIGDGAVVAASALVLAKTIVAPRALMAGGPAQFGKDGQRISDTLQGVCRRKRQQEGKQAEDSRGRHARPLIIDV